MPPTRAPSKRKKTCDSMGSIRGDPSDRTKDDVEHLNAKSKKKFEDQKKRTHRAPRWYSEQEGRALFMHDDITQAFANIGATSLLTMRYPAYDALTAEFLVSLRAKDVTIAEGGVFTFRLGNEDRQLNLEEWNEIFGFTRRSVSYRITEFPLDTFWGRLTGERSLPSGALPATRIASPMFRIILRILGNTLWARKENSRPTHRELSCLFNMLYQCNPKLDLGYELLVHLDNYKFYGGDLCVGGMITHLAVHFGVDLDDYTPRTPLFIDRTHLVSVGVLERVGTDIHSKFKGRFTALSALRMDLMYQPNWFSAWSGEGLHPDITNAQNWPLYGWARLNHDPEAERAADLEEEMRTEMRNEMPEESMYMGPSYAEAGPSRAAGEHSAEYNDLCAQIGQLRTDLGGFITRQDTFMTRQDAYMTTQQEFMTWARQQFPPPSDDPPPPPFF